MASDQLQVLNALDVAKTQCSSAAFTTTWKALRSLALSLLTLLLPLTALPSVGPS
ncbi:BnaA04g20990D [Brassica napus]|uniref:BnaA04g20990D protein n=1 Tax=Brassica napus TaxID=3708 RepID=A0A078HUG8_BRANA|nr:BnaA04g20990D [Brassica napus]